MCFIVVVSGEKQLKDFSKFLQNHSSSLNEILAKSIFIHDVNNDGKSKQRSDKSVIAPLSNKAKHIPRLKPSSSIGIDYSFDSEAISTIELINSNNKLLNKTIAVFVQLCMEVRQLCKEGDPILVKCLFADEELCELLNRDVENGANDGGLDDEKINGISLSASVIDKISNLLEMLFQAQQFIERCFIVISEIIKQFSALFSVESSNYINVDHSSLHFQVSVHTHTHTQTIVCKRWLIH